jgi:hypothetical protein
VILAILRELRPHKKFVDDYPDEHHLKVSIDQAESVALLNKWRHRPGKGGWTSLEDSIFDNISNPYLEVE